jgi:diguanylate cyclase (GGDEF)-like protein
LAYVVVVEAITVGVVAAAIVWQPSITGRYWLWFGLLLAASVIHLEAAQGIERIREIAAEGSPYTHMQSVWFFAGVLILPMPLQAALIALSFTHEWFRVFRGRALVYRKVFSAGTVILAVAAAGLALAAFYPGPHQPYITLLTGPRGTIAILVAAVAYRLVNYALVVGAIVATNPDKPARTALGHPSDQLIIAASVGLGYAVALLLTERPWSAPILLVTVLALHMGLLLPQFRAASRTDAKTGLVDPTWWSHTAERELDRARRLASSVGVLMLDIDHFKRVNDRYGHLAGDAVLRAVSDTLRHAVRSYDLIGRWGGEEFAVLLPGIDHDELHCSAERIRAAISVLTVTSTDRTGNEVTITDLTVSIGAGAYPDTAEELTPLLLATDDALYRAKDGGRNKTVLCPRVSR